MHFALGTLVPMQVGTEAHAPERMSLRVLVLRKSDGWLPCGIAPQTNSR
jgi:hypothetical protein